MSRNPKLVTFIFLALVFISKTSYPNNDPSEKQSSMPYLQDTALVRLGGQAFFLKDVERLQVSYKILSCLGESSFIEKFLRASRESLIPKPWKQNNIEKGSSLPQQLEAFILIEKLKLSSVSSASTKLTTMDLAKLSKKCSVINLSDLSSEDKSLFISELYLRQRFSTSKNLAQTMEDFIKSLNLQHNHELLRIRPSENSLKLLRAKSGADESSSSNE